MNPTCFVHTKPSNLHRDENAEHIQNVTAALPEHARSRVDHVELIVTEAFS